MSLIESILNYFGYVKKNKTRLVHASYMYMYWSSEVHGHVWFITSKTGRELMSEIIQNCKEGILKKDDFDNGITEDNIPKFIITSIAELG